MRILALSDLHGSYDVAVSILRDAEPWDVLVLAGDLTTHGTPAEAAEALGRLSASGRPLVAVCGNMDPPELEAVMATTGVELDGRGRVIDNVGFCGVSACPPTGMRTPYERDEVTIGERAESGWSSIANAETRVFVPHAPPAGTTVDALHNGRHVGSSAVRSFIERHTPEVVVCGHIHEARGIDRMGLSIIVNCGPALHGSYALIETGKTPHVELRS